MTKDYPQPKKGILDIAAYIPGSNIVDMQKNKISVSPSIKFYKLSSNETPLGAPGCALEAYQKAARRLEIYPDGTAKKLRQAIAKTYQLPIDRIMVGNGSDELLGLLANTYLSPKEEGIITEHGFSIYKIQIKAAGATPVVAKEKNGFVDINAILTCITERTRVVFITNPSNPTGTYLTIYDVHKLHEALPRHVLLILDGAYAEYVTETDYDAGIKLVSAHENVVMTRTFSKIYGLAGLRIGWMYAPLHVLDAVNRIRSPFNVNSAAQEAGVAAIKDYKFLRNSIAFNMQWRNWLISKLTELGLNITPSVTNFLLIHFPDTSGKNASRADSFLKAKGYILRRVSDYGFPNALRLSVGVEEANRGVVLALTDFLKKS